jgi:membrane protein DedA with SNARE-associated domain
MNEHGILIGLLVVTFLLFVLPVVLGKFIWIIIGVAIGWFLNNSYVTLRKRYP